MSLQHLLCLRAGQIIGLVLEYIAMLRAQGPQEWFFKELQAIAESTFRFQEASEAYDLVERLSMEMQFYEEKHILSGDDLFFEYDPEKIKRLLGLIETWCTVRVMLCS